MRYMASAPAIIEAPAPTPPAGPPRVGRPPTKKVRANATEEYIGLREYGAIRAAAVRALPTRTDDLTKVHGADLYEGRMMRSVDVASAVDTRIMAVLSRRIAIRPPVPRSDPRYAEAAAYAAECEANLTNLPRPPKRILRALLRGMVTGHKLAELIYDTRTDDPAVGPRMVLSDIKVKPRSSYALLADRFDNVKWIWPLSAGPVPAGPDLTPEEREKALPADKCMIYTHDPELGETNPSGTSILWGCYSDWLDQMNIRVDYLPYLANYAAPHTVYTDAPVTSWLPPLLNPDLPEDAITNPRREPLDVGLEIAAGLHNTSAAAIPNGALLVSEKPAGDGEAFILADGLLGRKIVKAITLQTHATEQSQYQPRNLGQVAQDMFELVVQYDRSNIAHLIQSVFRRLLSFNYGDRAMSLVPIVDLGQTASHDNTATWQAVSQLISQGAVFPSMVEELYGMVGLPIPDLDGDAQMPGIQVAQPIGPQRQQVQPAQEGAAT